MLGHAVMHSRDVSHFAPFHAMPCFIMHCRDVSHVVPCHAPSCIVVMCLILPSLLPPRFLPSHSTGRPVDCPLWECTALPNLTRWPLRSQCRYVASDSQVPAQSQHWQASVLPTVGEHSTFQPYAIALTVTVPVGGQLEVSAAWREAYWNPAHGHVLFADTAVGQAIAREAKGTYLCCLQPSGVVWDPISQQWEECTALQGWRRKIESTRAKSAGRSVPPPPRQLNLTIGPHLNLP